MLDPDNDEDVRRLLKSLHEPAVSSVEFEERLLERLRHEVSATKTAPHSRWGRPKLWGPIAASLISAVISYGIWLSLTKVVP